MSTTFQSGNQSIYDGTNAWAVGTDFRVSLHEVGYVADPDHDDMADTTDELAGGAYARVALAGESVVIDDANDQIECDATDATFAALEAAAGTPTQAIVYEHGAGVDANALLIAACTLTAPPLPNGGDYVIQWSAEGVMKIAS